MINSLDFTNSKDVFIPMDFTDNLFKIYVVWELIRIGLYYKPKEFLTVSKYLHLSLGMR